MLGGASEKKNSKCFRGVPCRHCCGATAQNKKRGTAAYNVKGQYLYRFIVARPNNIGAAEETLQDIRIDCENQIN